MRCRVKIAWFVGVVLLVSAVSYGYQQVSGASFDKGPWELVVQLSRQESGAVFPVSVSDRNKSERLNKLLPIMQTPVKVRLVEYVPELKWNISSRGQDGKGSVAKIRIVGHDFEQDVWLDSSDDQKSIMVTGMGGVELRKVYSEDTLAKIKEKLDAGKIPGLLQIWVDGGADPLEFVVTGGEELVVGKSKYKIKVGDYVPHYTIGRENKSVVNLSDEPINPALKISVDVDGEETEHWLWSRFSTPHHASKLPFKAEFKHFDLRRKGNYLLAVTDYGKGKVFYASGGKAFQGEAMKDQGYPLTDSHFAFHVEQLQHSAEIITKWEKGGEKLSSPALIASVEYGKTKDEVVLEFDKQYQYQSQAGSILLLFRSKSEGVGLTK